MPVTVIDVIEAKNAGTFPVVDDAGISGGFHAVADDTARDAIPAGRRKVGMFARVASTLKTYELQGGIENLNWEEVTGDPPADMLRDGGNSFAAPIAVGTKDAYALGLRTNDVDRVTVASDGARVGIGADPDPDAPLLVDCPTAFGPRMLANPLVNTDGSVDFRLGFSGPSPLNWLFFNFVYVGEDDPGNYGEINVGGGSGIYVNNYGIGIGCSNPTRSLEVQVASADGPFRLRPCALPVSPLVGDLAVDSNDENKLKWHNGGQWMSAFVPDQVSTTTPLMMRVDPVDGVSPAAGVKVHNQAEYDALGADLKYPQDAIDILPLLVQHPVNVALAAGTHLAKETGNINIDYGQVLTFPSLRNGSGVRMWEDWDIVGWCSGIYFHGEGSTEIDAEQAGTIASLTITRTSGSWSVDALVGKFAEIMSGQGAGGIHAIVSNTANAITTAGPTSAAGACTFRIFEPNAVLLSSYDGVAPFGVFGFSFDVGSDIDIYLENIRFGTDDIPFDGADIWGEYSVNINWCAFTMNGAVGAGFCGAYADTQGMNCTIMATDVKFLDGAYGLNAAYGGNFWFIYGTLFRGKPYTSKTFIVNYSGGRLWVDGLTIKADASYAAGLGLIYEGGFFRPDWIRCIGNSSCTGITLYDPPTNIMSARGTPIYVEGCGTAAVVGRGITYRGSFSSALGAGNTNGVAMSYGARMFAILNLTALVASGNQLAIDGANFAYTDLAANGDSIEGQYCSRIMRQWA